MGDLRALSKAYTDAFNSHDPDRIRAVVAENVVFTAPGDVELSGREAMVEYAMSWFNAFPDAEITVETEVIAGDWIANRFTFRGTHTETLAGPDGDIPATGKTLIGRGAEVTRVEDGLIAEDHLYFDQMQVLTQLGLVPAGAATA